MILAGLTKTFSNENVPPGTVVDRFITGFKRHQFKADKTKNVCGEKEFFLCSHKGLLGMCLYLFAAPNF